MTDTYIHAQAFVYRDTPCSSDARDHGATVRVGTLSLIFMGTPAEQVEALDALRLAVVTARLALAERIEPDGPPDSHWDAPDDSAYRRDMRDAGRAVA